MWADEEDAELAKLMRSAGNDDDWSLIAERMKNGTERSGMACEKHWDLYVSKRAGPSLDSK